MSPSTRVVTGVDDRGRPVAEWRPDPGAASQSAYGFMEPAYDAKSIERRQATPEELEAARAREAEPVHLTVRSFATPALNVACLPVTEPAESPEEPPVSEPPTNIPENIPGGLDRLAEAASAARDAHQEKEAADAAWDVAREALARAYADVEAIVEPMPTPDDDHAHHFLTVPITPVVPEPNGGGPVRSRTGEGQRPGQAAARDRRAAAVMSAMERLGDDMGAVATELGMKKNAVAQIVKFARKRAEA